VINVAMLVALGYDPALSADRVQVTTGSGVEHATQVELQTDGTRAGALWYQHDDAEYFV
jgi:hypothetical protein